RAWELRAPLRQQRVSAYRWIFGEADSLPGVTVDLYGAFAVLHTYCESVEALLPWLSDGLRATAPLRGILLRRRAQERGGEDTEDEPGGLDKIERLWGALPPRDLVVEEHGLRFHANLFVGQKTGLFLD